MKLKRDDMKRHLKRIACGGLIDEVVFHGAFEAIALSDDQLLAVIAPIAPGAKKLKQEIGIGRLGHLQKALDLLKGSGQDAVNVRLRVETHRLVIDDQERGSQYILTAQPSTIGTQVEPETAKAFAAKVDEMLELEPIGIGDRITLGIQSTFKGLAAEEVELHVGEEDGYAIVGNETNSDFARIEIPGLGHGGESDDFSLLFGRELVEVLGIIHNFSTACLYVSGPGSMIMIQDGPPPEEEERPEALPLFPLPEGARSRRGLTR